MFEVIILVLSLIISLIIVIKAADVFVDSIVEIGLALGISEIILGSQLQQWELLCQSSDLQ